MVDKQGILHWCASVRSTFEPRTTIPRGETPRQVPEQFLATALNYLQALAEEPQPEPPNLFRVWFVNDPPFYRHVRANDSAHADQVAHQTLARYPSVSLQILKITPEPIGLLECTLTKYLERRSTESVAHS